MDVECSQACQKCLDSFKAFYETASRAKRGHDNIFQTTIDQALASPTCTEPFEYDLVSAELAGCNVFTAHQGSKTAGFAATDVSNMLKTHCISAIAENFEFGKNKRQNKDTITLFGSILPVVMEFRIFWVYLCTVLKDFCLFNILSDDMCKWHVWQFLV